MLSSLWKWAPRAGFYLGEALGFLVSVGLLAACTERGPRPVLSEVQLGQADAPGGSYQEIRPGPFSFHPNLGQFESDVEFVSRSRDSMLLFKTDEFQLFSRSTSLSHQPLHKALTMRLVDADPRATVRGQKQLPGIVNYLRGNDPARWQTALKTYQRVHYQSVYPGTDLLFYGTSKDLEYDFVLGPGADPEQIRLRFDHPVEIDSSGDLSVATPAGILKLRRPVTYQHRLGTQQEIPSRYRRLEGGDVGFWIGDYDRRYALTIDPVVVLSSFLGGGEADSASGVQVDARGDIYITGLTSSINFPTSAGASQQAPAGGADIFVTKLNAQGDSMIYSTYVGGEGDDLPATLGIDSSGNVYVTGQTTSQDFPVAGAFQEEYGGGTSDAFLFKLNPNGTGLAYSTFLGGRSNDTGNIVRIDSQGNAYVAGFTRSDDFPVTEGVLQPNYRGGLADAFALKMNPAGSSLLYSTYLGGNRQDEARDIGFDAEGNAVVVGLTDSTNFPTAEPFQGQRNGQFDVFVSKLDGEASTLVFSTYLGGSSSDVPFGAIVDEAGDIYIVGETGSFDFPTESALQPAKSGSLDAFVTKFRGDGAGPIFSTFLGGSGFDSGRAIDVTDSGGAVIAGVTTSADFPTLATLMVDPQGTDAFLAALNPSGSGLQYSTYVGGPGTEFATGLALDAEENAYVVGSVDRPGFSTLAALQDSFGGKGVFVSANRAGNWQGSGEGLSNPNIESLVVHPDNSALLYAGTSGGGVFKSSDTGETWSSSGLEFQQVLALDIDATNDILFAGTTNGLFKSEDGGENWDQMREYLPFAAFPVLVVDSKGPETVYAGSQGRGVFKTTDSGARWRAINNGLRGSAQQILSLVIDPGNSRQLYIATPRAVYSSSNGGATWQMAEANLEDFSTISTLIVDAGGPATLYASGISDTTSIPPEFCDFAPPCNNFVLKSTDRGTNWDLFAMGGPVSSLALDPSNRSTLYAGTFRAGVFKSTDGGETWEEANSGLQSLQVTALSLDPSNSSRLYVGTRSSSDGFFLKIAPTQVFFFAQIGEGSQGQIRLQTTLILINTGGDTVARVEFLDSSGQPLEVTLGDLGSDSMFEIPLARGAAFSAQTAGEGPVRVGYARVTTSSGVGGTAVFTRTDIATGVVLYEAGVPASPALSGPVSLFVDSLNNKDTGLALVVAGPENLNPSGNTEVNLDLFDRDGNQIGQQEWNLEQGEHRSIFVPQIFAEIAEQVGEMQGVLRVRFDQPVTGLTLLQGDDPGLEFPAEIPTLTSLPLVERSGVANLVYLPQVADGTVIIPPGVTADDKFQTGFLFVNSGVFPALVTLDLFGRDGEPLELTLGDQGTDSTFQVFVSPGFFFSQSSGEGSLSIGYARVSSSTTALGVAAVFTQTDLRNQTVLYEAGVPAASPLREFSLFVDTLGVGNTGLALVNPDLEEEAVIQLRLYDKNSNLINREEIVLGPGRHLAQFVTQLFSQGQAQLFEMEGVLTVESSQPLAAVTLRVRDDPQRDFPADVPTLATFPVIPGRARLDDPEP